MFMTWLLSLRKKNGDTYASSSYNSHRAALFNLYRDFGATMSTELESELKNHYKGLKRKVASDIAAGGGQIKVGKDPLSFSLFRFLGLELLKLACRESVFAHAFMILAWNLMARAANTFDVCHNHMEWVEDALCIYFAQMKNDQMGERPRDPRHIYANPLCPEICPILALAIYWSCFDFIAGEINLFPGSNQYERFRKILARVVLLDQVAEELERRSIVPEDIGTHSMRKGASSFCASGSTSCPSSTAVHLRAGWSLGGVQDTYLRYEGAGDMYVGRTVSGLPIDSPDFCLLPPHFKGADTQLIRRALGLVFPNIPGRLNAIGEFAMASLVYHRQYLLDTLPQSHPLFASVLFRTSELYDQLKVYVECTQPNNKSMLRATGIPAHVSILSKMKEMYDALQRNIEVQQQNIQLIIEGVMQKLEEKAVGLGTVTQVGLSDTIMKCLEEAGVMRVVRAIENPPSNACETQSTSRTPRNASYNWGGKLHFFPEDFQFPKGTPLEAWRYWCVGDELNGYPPLKRLTPDELGTKNLRKRLSDFKFVMNKIEARASELGIAKASPSEEEAIEIYNSCSGVIEIPPNTTTGKRRRTGQLTWMTAVDILRKRAASTTHTYAVPETQIPEVVVEEDGISEVLLDI